MPFWNFSVPFWHDVRTYFTKNSWPFHHTAIYWMQYWICRSMNMDHAMWTYLSRIWSKIYYLLAQSHAHHYKKLFLLVGQGIKNWFFSFNGNMQWSELFFVYMPEVPKVNFRIEFLWSLMYTLHNSFRVYKYKYLYLICFECNMHRCIF